MTEIENVKKNLERIHALDTVLRVCKSYGVSLNRIVSRDRSKTTAHARHHAWTLIRNSLAMSYPEIGAVWNVDHTTVIAGVRKHESRAL